MKLAIWVIILAASPVLGYCAESKYEDLVGKKYWVTGRILSLNKGACGEQYAQKYEAKSGQSFKITDVKDRIPHNDNSGYWTGLNIEFNNGEKTCMDARFFKFASRDISETNPSDDYSGKKFWVKKSYSFSDEYHKGKCTEEGRLKSYYFDNDKFTPKTKQTFVVNEYFPGKSTFDSKIEVTFEGNQIVCAEIYKIRDYITTEPPERNEKIVSEKLKAAGLSVDKHLWLKYPNKHMPGLTKVMIEKIDIAFDDIIEFTIGSEDYDSYTDELTINELLDRMYLKLPGKFKKLSKKVANAIEKQQVILGMTTDQAIASWGEPSSVNRTAGSWGIHEQWVYGDNTYLYFKNGKLTSWQD